MQSGKIYVSELSTSKHIFNNYHFCRGNSNLRKTRIGVIIKGSGTYIYLNKKLNVNEGDIVFIPENIYCYSEWHGNPEIEVIYVSCFMHYKQWRYEPQIIYCDKEIKNDLIKIANLLSIDYIKELEAYSLFYKLLQKLLPQMTPLPWLLNLLHALAHHFFFLNRRQRNHQIYRQICHPYPYR